MIGGVLHMKKIFALFSLGLIAVSCAHQSSQTWEDMKTAGRYVQRGVDSLWGKDYESKLLASDDEFVGPYDDDYLALSDSDLKSLYMATDAAIPQPRGTPGENGVPLLSQFYSPKGDLAELFHSVYFETDEHILRNKADLQAMMQLGAYLKKHPEIYIVVSGHCDERASASYNMALGMRRSNSIRALLAKQGVDPNRVYTVSRGKEEPVAMGHSPEDWKQNRRAEFKIFER